MADFFQRTEKAMGMSDATWQRHANPWSGWTRIPILPLLALAIWSRDWIGWWCLAPTIALIAWTFVNPRAFPPPPSTDNWMSQGVLGERVFLARKTEPIPHHHANWGIGLSVVAALGLPPLVYGLWALEVWPALLGLTLTVGAKMWFLDRMVWLLADTTRHPQASSLHPPA
ncbi:MAG: hypothetical protein RIC24_03930 [Hyphomicrobiales bacterium]|jgi:hypothetical protein